MALCHIASPVFRSCSINTCMVWLDDRYVAEQKKENIPKWTGITSSWQNYTAFFSNFGKGRTRHSIVFAKLDWAISLQGWKKTTTTKQFKIRKTSHCFSWPNNNKAPRAHSIIQTIPLYWTTSLHCTCSQAHRWRRRIKKLICAHRLFYAPVDLIHLLPLLKRLRLWYESMYQSSEPRWDINPLIDLWLQSKCTEAALALWLQRWKKKKEKKGQKNK